MKRIHIRGRSRILDPEKKAKLCDMVAKSATIEQAAETLDVSLRTVQRERKFDEDFDHELRLALQAPPDPKKLMESAARVHWRAAAWLLERTDPERYAKRPASSASPRQVEAALTFVLEAALEATPAEQQEAVYQHVQAACEEAFTCVFPNYGPWGNPRSPKLPPTPLVDEQLVTSSCDSRRAPQLFDHDEQGNLYPPELAPVKLAKQRAASPLKHSTPVKEHAPPMNEPPSAVNEKASPKKPPAKARVHETTPPRRPSESLAADRRLPWQFNLRSAQTAESLLPDGETGSSDPGILSPKRRFATKFEIAGEPPETPPPPHSMPRRQPQP